MKQLEGYESKIPKSAWYVTSNEPADWTSAYKWAGKKPIYPTPDFLSITPGEADALYQLGTKCGKIAMENIPIPIFSIEMFIDSSDAFSNDVIEPEHPYRDDCSCYAANLTFVHRDLEVICHMELCDSNDGGGGSNDVCVFGFTESENGKIRIMPLALDEDCLIIWNTDEIERVARWAVMMWKGVQYRFLHRPERFAIKHNRIKKERRDYIASSCLGKINTVKVQRVISINIEASDGEPIEIVVGNYHMSCPCWGVIGHWRTYKSGKRVWIAAYQKGSERDKQSNYKRKQYEFVTEDK